MDIFMSLLGFIALIMMSYIISNGIKQSRNTNEQPKEAPIKSSQEYKSINYEA